MRHERHGLGPQHRSAVPGGGPRHGPVERLTGLEVRQQLAHHPEQEPRGGGVRGAEVPQGDRQGDLRVGGPRSHEAVPCGPQGADVGTGERAGEAARYTGSGGRGRGGEARGETGAEGARGLSLPYGTLGTVWNSIRNSRICRVFLYGTVDTL